jgi:hypothetical protein
MSNKRWVWQPAAAFVAALGLAVVGACSSSGSSSPSSAAPTAPTQAAATSASAGDDTAARSGVGGPEPIDANIGGSDASVVEFPPRDQAFRFRQDLEAYYRDVFRRAATSSFVDIEGTIVWTQEYLRYRVNSCSHDAAVSRVMAQIDGSTNTAGCSSTETPFPPRNEPFAFRQTLEAKYRDGLRRQAGTTFVDTEGDIVWTQEYLRYRTTGCNDAQATDRVRSQLAGGAPPAGCSTTTTTTSTTTTTVPPSPNPIASFTVSDRPCRMTGGGSGVIANCTFDGRASTPSTGASIISHSWSIGSINFGTNPTMTNPSLPCGNIPGNSNLTFELPVTLAVRDSSGQTVSQTQSIQFNRISGCGL